jgi:hypothetical protein
LPISREYVLPLLGSCGEAKRELTVIANPTSYRQTLRADDSEKEDSEIPAKFLGFTPGGSPIVKFSEDLGCNIEPDQGVVIGRSDGHVIIAFRKAMTVADSNRNSLLGISTPNSSRNHSYNNSGVSAAAAEPPNSLPGPSNFLRPPPVVRIASPPTVLPGDSPV